MKNEYLPHKKVIECFNCRTRQLAMGQKRNRQYDYFCYCKKCGKYLSKSFEK